MRWRPIVGAVFAGVGVNAIILPAAVRSSASSLPSGASTAAAYPTIAATLILLSLFDFVVARLARDLGRGRRPPARAGCARSLVRLRLGRGQPARALITLGVILLVLLAVLLWFAEQIGDFKQRIAQGFARSGTGATTSGAWPLWQALDWSCRFVAVLFFLSAFRLPATIQRAARPGLGRARRC